MRRVELKFIKDPLLRRSIPGVGSARQARNESRWIKQEVPTNEVNWAVFRRGRQGVPLQYILQSQPFGPLEISCKQGVLIPRWETEEWVTKLAERCNSYVQKDGDCTQILDIGTGSGCISFLLTTLIPNSRGTALDISPDAIDSFKKNRRKLGLQQKTEIIRHNSHDPLPHTVLRQSTSIDIVVSNPPYIKELHEADYDVQKYEPELALLEQPHIYEDLVKRVMETSAKIAVFEVGNKQQIDLCIRSFDKHGWYAWGCKDSADNWRTVWATTLENFR